MLFLFVCLFAQQLSAECLKFGQVSCQLQFNWSCRIMIHNSSEGAKQRNKQTKHTSAFGGEFGLVARVWFACHWKCVPVSKQSALSLYNRIKKMMNLQCKHVIIIHHILYSRLGNVIYREHVIKEDDGSIAQQWNQIIKSTATPSTPPNAFT